MLDFISDHSKGRWSIVAEAEATLAYRDAKSQANRPLSPNEKTTEAKMGVTSGEVAQDSRGQGFYSEFITVPLAFR